MECWGHGRETGISSTLPLHYSNALEVEITTL
jgi:hypothetical protein